MFVGLAAASALANSILPYVAGMYARYRADFTTAVSGKAATLINIGGDTTDANKNADYNGSASNRATIGVTANFGGKTSLTGSLIAYKTGNALVKLAQPCTTYTVARTTASGTRQYILDGNNVTNRIRIYAESSGANARIAMVPSNAVYGTESILNGRTRVWAVVHAGTQGNTETYYDDANLARDNNSDLTNSAIQADGICIGGQYDATSPWIGEWAETIIYEGIHTWATQKLISDYLLDFYGLAAGLPALFTCEGDSIMQGPAAISANTNPWGLLRTDLAGPSVACCASPGYTAASIRSPAKVAVMDSYGHRRAKRIAVYWAGGNQLIGSAANAVYNDIIGWCTDRLALDWDAIVLYTILPRITPTFNGLIEVLNPQLRSWILTQPKVVLCDVAADPIMGDYATLLDPAYYLDGIHPTVLGQNVLRGTASAAATIALTV